MASSQNQEDVDVFDSWEDMDINETEVLDRKLNEILDRDRATHNVNSNEHKSTVNVILLGDDALRSQYVPPEPTVKILKRPTKDTQLLNGDCKPRQQFKTLKQREQEYAEARLRILGEAHIFDNNHDDYDEQRLSSSSSCTTNSDNCIQSVHTSGPERETVIRMPRGPDGTKGFHLRR